PNVTVHGTSATPVYSFSVITPDSAGGFETCTTKATCTSSFLTAHWPDAATQAANPFVVHLTGEATQGEAWSLTLPLPFRYTVKSGDTASIVANALAAAITGANAGFKATASGGAVTVTSPAGIQFTLALAGGAGSVSGAVATVGTPAVGATYTLTITGAYAHSVTYGDDLSSIARAIAALVPASVFDATVIGRTITVARVDGAAFNPSFSISGKSAGSMTVNPQLVFTTG